MSALSRWWDRVCDRIETALGIPDEAGLRPAARSHQLEGKEGLTIPGLMREPSAVDGWGRGDLVEGSITITDEEAERRKEPASLTDPIIVIKGSSCGPTELPDRLSELVLENFLDGATAETVVRPEDDHVPTEEEHDMGSDKSLNPTWLASVEQRPATCKSCSAAIFWGRTTNGKRVPVDAVPVGGKYISHFATCPNAEKHRVKTKGGGLTP